MSKLNEKIEIDIVLAEELQALLKQLGYYDDEIDCDWNTATQQAFAQFTDMENLEERVDISKALIDLPALDYICTQFVD